MKKPWGLIIALMISATLHAQITQKIAAAADKIESKCIAWRKDIHQNPELGNREVRTAKLTT